MTEQRQCTDCHQPFTPEGSAIMCPSCVQDRIDDQMFQDDEDCGQCDGSGYTYDCIDGCCANPEDGCRLCERRCDFCNPFKPTPEQMRCGRAIHGDPAICTCGTCGSIPGPWHVDPDDREDMEFNNHIVAANGNTVCFMAWSGDRDNNEPHERAARLIAAAPTMLETLQTTRGNIVSLRNAALPGPLEEWLRVVDEAISLATSQ